MVEFLEVSIPLSGTKISQGECVLTVQLSEEECVEDEEDVEFYLLFSGSTQRHLTTTLRLGHVTLQAVCPAHNRDETVRVTLCQARPGGSVDSVAEERFQFVHDLALDMAHFLLSAATHRDGLEGVLLLTDTHLPLQETKRLDQTLTLALKHLRLPPGRVGVGFMPAVFTAWGFQGEDFCPQETLLHFAARRGLRKVALFLLQQPGGRDALQLANKNGYTPARLAQSRGHTQLQHLLSEIEKSPHLETKAPRRCYPAGRAFLHHPRLNTFTLTVENEADGDASDLKRDVEELRRYVRSHHHSKAGSPEHLQSLPVILSRDFVAVTPSEVASLQKASSCEHQEVETETESGRCTNGSTRSEEEEVSVEARASHFNSGNSKTRTLGLEGAGVCVRKPEHLASVSGVSCTEQQQEEVDSESREIREAPRTLPDSETKVQDKAKSGNTMGQTQGLLPEKEEKNEARGDLPEEREGECDSTKETGKTQMPHRQTRSQQRSQFYLDLDVDASEKAPEIQVQESGSGNDVTFSTKLDQDLSEDSQRLTMAPGPVHDVHLKPSPDVHQLPDMTSGDQIEALLQTSEPSSLVSIQKEPSPLCQDLADAAPGPAEGLVLDVPLVAEEHIRETRMDHQTLFPETEECFLPGLESDIQHETSQIPTKEPSQEHCEPQPDIKHFPIMDAIDQIGDPGSSYQSLPFALDQRSKVSPDLMSEEAGCGLESQLEREPVAFQTPPESPCEYFSVDGSIKMNDSIEELFPASVDLSHAAGPRATTEVGEKVETEMPELCEISKKSPVMILCGSFSKLTIRGSPPNLHLDSKTSENIEREAVSAGDSQASTTHSTEIEMEENKEEVKKMEPEFVEKCEGSEPSQISAEEPPCNSVFKMENLEGTAVIEHDQPPEYSDVQEELMKVPSQLGENPEIASLPCEPLSPSISVSKNITELHSEVNNQTFEDLQPELVTSTETVVETPLLSHFEVNKIEENTVEQLEVMTSEESISDTLDVPHELIASYGESTVETSPDPLPEAKTSEKSTQDQQPKISEDSSRETSLDLPHDLITSSVDTIGIASHVSHPDINSHEESIHFKYLDKSRNDLHDLKHEVTTFQESIRGTPELNHDLIATSEEAIGETSCDLLSEGNRSQENVLDKQAESMTCEKRKNETSQDPNFEVTTSEGDLEGPNHELITCGEIALEEQLEVTSCEEIIGQTPHHTQCEEKACEENLRTTLDFMSTEMERCLADAPVHTETTSLDALVSGDDSGLDLENVPTPGLVQISDLDQPVDLDSGSGLDMDVCSAVEVNSGLIQDVPPLENVICESGALDEEKHQEKEEEKIEEPKGEQIEARPLTLCVLQRCNVTLNSEFHCALTKNCCCSSPFLRMNMHMEGMEMDVRI
ncbi:A-kinase anchor protein 13 isoform X8 [Silurus asotus]|uniref:A-kinase anchor protein 13 isoform X8 n=1 Tax=Silurus asotus TaxID=30991 RepID=A0AAD5FIL8_SILAS|nr:A-kinase anchor protein 13 isoform X8 [Silurus asotus]